MGNFDSQIELSNSADASFLRRATTSKQIHSTMSKGNIHDLLSIGEIESALSSNDEKQAEINRLPLFLRLLASGQPLSAVPNLMPNQPTIEINDNNSSKKTNATDPFVNAVVSRLEDVAATHSAAESMDVLVSHIAPSTCRRMSKLGPLKRKHPNQWFTSELAATSLAPLSNVRGRKRMMSSTGINSDGNFSPGDSDDNLDSGDEMEDVSDRMQDLSEKQNNAREKFGRLKRMRSEGRESLMIAGLQEDSQEAHLTRLLSELASLVVQSLQPPPTTNKQDDEEAPEATLGVKADSLLSDSETATIGNELGACIAVIMHHSPVLRHRHVASALCRASVPQAPTLIFRMGANSPNGIACLVRGCMDAVMVDKRSIGSNNTEEVVSIAKASVRKLASLSTRESARIRGMLESTMIDVKLELSLKQDAVEAACLLTQHLGGKAKSGSESLKTLLQANPSMVSKCYECLLNRVGDLDGASGELKLTLRALVWLIVSVYNVKSVSLVSAADLLGKKLTGLCNVEGALPEKSEKDAVFLFLLSGSLALCTLLGLSGHGGADDEMDRKVAKQRLLKTLLSVCPPSTKSNVIVSRAAASLHSQELSGVQDLITEALSSSCAALDSSLLQDGFTKLCKWAVINGDLDTICNRTLTHSAVVLDPSALIQMIVASTIEPKKLESLMKAIFENSESASKLLRHKRAYELLEETVRFLYGIDNQAVPLVSRVSLSALVRKAISKKADVPHTLRDQMVINFIYSLVFFDETLHSPFAFDLRDQPVVEILQLIKESELEEVHNTVRLIVQKHTPDIADEADALNPANATILEVSNECDLKHQDMLKLLSAALRKNLQSPDSDPSGLKVERTYLLAQRRIPFSQVDCLLISTLVALPNTPAPFFTYGMLCRDPLVLLQCPVSVWQCRGMRRSALSTLGRLLSANDSLTRQASQSEDVVNELLTSRNVVLLRCLLSLASGKGLVDHSDSSLTKPCQCHVLTGMIRSLVANQTGLIATLIKHGLPDEVIDWLVDCVPECVNDSSALTTLLSERSPLSAAERLKTADAALRITIAFGSRDEVEGKNLANFCLHQLVSSFYLVLGPVGVPVNALIEENGMDLTQVCRKATFRILSALQNVRGSRIGLKNECSMALQKLASLCKSESGMAGVGGVVANRRKALLKEIWDALVKALNAMGSGVGLN